MRSWIKYKFAVCIYLFFLTRFQLNNLYCLCKYVSNAIYVIVLVSVRALQLSCEIPSNSLALQLPFHLQPLNLSFRWMVKTKQKVLRPSLANAQYFWYKNSYLIVRTNAISSGINVIIKFLLFNIRSAMASIPLSDRSKFGDISSHYLQFVSINKLMRTK